MLIGFFDSGIGGVTVLKEALRMLPQEDYLYYADTLNVPYGTKTKEEVKGFISEAAGFIAKRGVQALVVACNTATSIAINDLRKKYPFPIIGMEPAVKPAVEKTRDKRVLVLATPLTLKEEKFRNLVSRVDSERIVDTLPLPGLVDFAERFVFDEDMVIPYLREKLSAFEINCYGTVVLGCTHFPFYRKSLRSIFSDDVDIIDGNTGTVRHLKNILEEKCSEGFGKGSGKIAFYSSQAGDDDERKLERYLDILE